MIIYQRTTEIELIGKDGCTYLVEEIGELFSSIEKAMGNGDNVNWGDWRKVKDDLWEGNQYDENGNGDMVPSMRAKIYKRIVE